jgi:PAS domain S-box-containing protein
MPALNTEIEKQPATVESLQAENDDLRRRLEEAEETISAIRSGAVDALVVEESAGHRIYTLEGADRPYRLFVEEMQQGAATLHADGTIAWCNRQLAELLKTSQEKLVGASLHNFVSPESRAVYDNLLWQGKTHSGRGQAQLRRTGGGMVPAYFIFNALPKDCGGGIGVLVTDQTSQRHHEQLTAAHAALRESERRFREMIDALPVAIYTTDAKGRLTHFNAAAVEFSGRTPELGTDQWCVSFKLYRPDGTPLPHDECPMAIALKEGRVARGVEAIAERPDGTRVWFTPYPTPLRDSAGHIVGGINMLLDITERKQAEERLRRAAEFDEAVMTNMGEGLYTVDNEGLVTSMNPAAEKLFGWTLDELRGRKMHDMTHYKHPDGSPFPAADCAGLQVLREGGILTDQEDVFIRKDGTFFDVVYSSAAIREDGKITGLVVVFRDMTERKHAEEARARLSAIVDSSDDAIISKTVEGVVTSWNAGAERLLGYRAEEMVGQPIIAVIPPDHQDEEREILRRLRRGERVEHFETIRMAKGGRRIEVSLSISPIHDVTGKVIGVSKIMRDITERKQAEESLRLAQAKLADRARQLEEAVAERTAELTTTNRQLEAFVYSVAHDLRAPLRSMEGFSAMLVEEAGSALSETGREFAHRINRAAQFMDTLLMDLLTFSGIAQQRIELTAVNLETVVQSVLSRLENEIQEKNARVETSGPWLAVLAHGPTLGQVLINLVSNALKFVAPGVAPVVRVRIQEGTAVASLSPGDKSEHLPGSWVRVWVEDNGIGIAPEHQEQVFRLFGRLHGDAYGGTGVGLAIVQKGTERMGGRAGVESAPGQGSRFWFEIRKA